MKEIVVDDNVTARQCVAVVKKLVRVRYDNDDMREMRESDKEVDLELPSRLRFCYLFASRIILRRWPRKGGWL